MNLAPPSLVPPCYQRSVFWLPIYSQKSVLKIKCSKIKKKLTAMFKIKISKNKFIFKSYIKN
jgi:hypothetical protein